MEFLKEFLGEDLYNQVAEKLKGNDKVKLVNIASAGYVHTDKEGAYESVRRTLITTRGKVFRNNKVIKTDTFKPKGLLSNPVTLTECYDCIIE